MSTTLTFSPAGEPRNGLKIRVQAVRLRPWALEEDPPVPPPFKRQGANGRTPPEIRFWRKVEKRGVGWLACWIWTGSLCSDGYGNFAPAPTRSRAGLVLAHRWAYEQATGEPLSPDLVLLHACDTPACVRPVHLSPGTNRDNMLDALAKGRLVGRARNLAGAVP